MKKKTALQRAPKKEVNKPAFPIVKAEDGPAAGNFIQHALDRGASIETIERLVALYESNEQKKAFKAFHEAMARLQSTLPVIPHNENGHEGYSYATISQIVKVAGPHIASAGFSYRFEIQPVEKKSNPVEAVEEIVAAVKKFDFEKEKLWKLEKILTDILVTRELEVTCVVTHIDGHSERTSMTGPEDHSGFKNAIQSRGSSATYLERYSLIGAFGIVTADSDPDGRQASAKKPNGKQAQDKKQAPPKATPIKPAMNDEQYKKAFQRISKGEDILQMCRDRYTLTEAQDKGLAAGDEIRKAAAMKAAADTTKF